MGWTGLSTYIGNPSQSYDHTNPSSRRLFGSWPKHGRYASGRPLLGEGRSWRNCLLATRFFLTRLTVSRYSFTVCPGASWNTEGVRRFLSLARSSAANENSGEQVKVITRAPHIIASPELCLRYSLEMSLWMRAGFAVPDHWRCLALLSERTADVSSKPSYFRF